MLDNLQDILTVENVSDFLLVSPQTVIKEIRENHLKAFKVRGQYRIRKSNLIIYIDREVA